MWIKQAQRRLGTVLCMREKLSTGTAVMLVMPPLLWAGNAVVGRVVGEMISPMTLNFVRWALAGLILLPVAHAVLRRSGPLSVWPHWKRFALLGLLGVVVFAGMVAFGQLYPETGLIRVDTWISRVQTFLHSEDGGYQVQQAKIAIAKGGIIGEGPGNSMMRNYLPYCNADFIYAIICEEYGLIGGTVILVLYVMLFIRNVKLVTKSPKAFGAFLAIGLSLLLTVQALANIAVNVNLVPATGLTLPMISMGGTSMLFTSISLGMILSVSKFIESLD